MSTDAQVDERRRTPVASYVSLKSRKPGKRTRPGIFLKGPIPWAWLAAASRLNGQALQIGVVLWLEVGFSGEHTVRLLNIRATELGVSRWSRYRALDALEAAGLIHADRQRGRSTRVTVLVAPSEPTAPATYIGNTTKRSPK